MLMDNNYALVLMLALLENVLYYLFQNSLFFRLFYANTGTSSKVSVLVSRP